MIIRSLVIFLNNLNCSVSKTLCTLEPISRPNIARWNRGDGDFLGTFLIIEDFILLSQKIVLVSRKSIGSIRVSDRVL